MRRNKQRRLNVAITVRLPTWLHTQIQVRAHESARYDSEVVRDALMAYFSQDQGADVKTQTERSRQVETPQAGKKPMNFGTF